MQKSILVGFLGLLGLLTAGPAQVSGQTLSKDQAKNVIESTDNYKPRKWPIFLAKADVDACVGAGYLKWDTVGSGKQTGTTLSVTDKGKPFFDSASGGKQPGAKQADPLFVEVATPIKPQVIEITNITDGDGGTKVVEYQWNWDSTSQPKEIQDLLFKNQSTNNGKVVVKMDGDMWKVVKFQ